MSRLDDKFDEFREMLKVDKHNLDGEFVDFPFNYQEICEICSELYQKYDRKKTKFTADQINIAEDIRNKSDEKISDTKMALILPADPVYQEMQEEVADAKALYDKWSNLRGSMDHKSRAIKELANLFIAGYWVVTAGGETLHAAKDVSAAVAKAALKEVRDTKTAERKAAKEEAAEKPFEEVDEVPVAQVKLVPEVTPTISDKPDASLRSRMRSERLSRTVQKTEDAVVTTTEEVKQTVEVVEAPAPVAEEAPVRRGLRRNRA